MPPANRDQRIQTTCLLLLSSVALALSLFWLKNVMVPFVLAVFLSFSLAPLIDVLIRRAKLPRLLALVVTIGIALTSMTVFGGMVTNSVKGMARNLDSLETGFVEMLERGAAALRFNEFQETVAAWTAIEERLEDEFDAEGDATDGSTTEPASDTTESASDTTEPASEAVDDDALVAGSDDDTRAEHAEQASSLVAAIGRRVVPAIGSVLNGITTLLSKSVLVLIFLMFLLGGRQEFDIRDNNTTLGVIERQVRSYLLTKIVASLATGVLTAIALRLIGVPNAMLFGLLAFLLNFIPSIGSIIAALLPLPVALVTFGVADSEAIMKLVLTLVVPGGIQFAIGNVIEPKVMGDSLDLHPVVVMLSLIFWGTIWGPVGMLLATPITAVIRIMLEKLEPTQPFARAMSGKLGT